MLSNISLSRLTPYADEIIRDYQCGLRHNNSFNIHGTVHPNMTRSKSPTRCNSVTEFLLFHLHQ
jgi:hypothetical protein